MIFFDILKVYKHFFYWNLSKIYIVMWSFLLWIILTSPILFIICIVAFFDPIRWLEILAFIVGGTDPTLEIFALFSSYPYWLILMFFLSLWAFFMFLIGNSYKQYLYAKLHQGIIKWENLPYFHDSFFSKIHIIRLSTLITYNLLILLIPSTIVVILFFILYFLHASGFISFGIFSWWLLILTLATIFTFSYIIFRLLFSVIILSWDDKKSVEKHTAFFYIKKSILLTKWYKIYLKFLFILGIIFLLLSPFRWFEENLASDREKLKYTIEYRALLLTDTQAAEEYPKKAIAESFSDMSDREIASNFKIAGYIWIAWFFISFFILSGLYSVAFVSFYLHVIHHKK